MSGDDAVRVFAPATVANVACGIDIFGFALEGLGDTVALRRCEEPGLVIEDVAGDKGALPWETERNTATVAAKAVLTSYGDAGEGGFRLRLTKGLPLASGMGSSAASAVAGAVAMDTLLEAGLTPRALLRCAAAGERVACGSDHADNVAASLHGGFILVRGDLGRVESLPVPPDLFCALLHPMVTLSTERSRAVLPTALPFPVAVRQWGHAAALVTALFRGDLELLATALNDAVAEPYRRALIPGFKAVCAAAEEAGALGCSISGAGPSIFALCAGRTVADRVAVAMRLALLDDTGLDSEAYVSPVGGPGARQLEEGEEGRADESDVEEQDAEERDTEVRTTVERS